MLKNLLRDSFIYTVSTVLSRGIVFFLLPILAVYLTPEEFGVLDLFVIFIALSGVTIGGELSQSLARFTPEAGHEHKATMISTVLWTTIALYLIFIVIGCLFPQFLSNLIAGSPGYSKVLILVFFLSLFVKIEYILRSQLRWDLQVKLYAYISIVYTLVHATSIYIALAHYNSGIFGYFIGQFIATLLALCLSLVYNRQYISFRYSGTELKELFAYSSPLIFSSLTIILSTYVDRLVINDLLTLKDLGLYGMGYRFASMGSFLLVGVQGALMPIIYKEYKKEATKDKLKDFFQLFYVAVLSMLVAIVFFSKELLIVLTSPQYYSVDFIIPILSAAVLFNGMYIFGVGITIMKKTKVFLYVGIFGLIMNLVLNYLLIPIWGVVGASIATFITSVLGFLIYMYVSQKHYKVPYDTFRILLGSILVVLLFYILKVLLMDYINQLSVGVVIIKVVLVLIFSLMLSFGILGMGKMKYYIGFLKSKISS